MQISKWISKILQMRVCTFIFIALWIFAIIKCFGTYRCYYYDHIPLDEIPNELYKVVNPNLVLKRSKPGCTYHDVLQSRKSFNAWEVQTMKFDNFSAKGIYNGSYVPEHCNPIFSVAILVTYRNRQSQLNMFIPYMHNFLREQNIHYKIYVIEQKDDNLWNKGALYNIGARQAIADKFPCLVLHDVDLLPLTASNLYACTRLPRHLSASIDKFRYILPYPSLVGGVLAVRADHFQLVNGFSNRFEAWGGEDDDFGVRMAGARWRVVRFGPRLARYTMLVHRPEPRNPTRLRVLEENRRGGSAGDGLDSLRYRSVRCAPQRLYTLIAVHL